jgi:uncharacterized membrane protein
MEQVLKSYSLSRSRINSIDILRGLLMVIMAVDHTREFFHHDALIGNDPTNLETTSPLLFFTRWITHFCAPVFVFLSGSSIFLYSQKVNSKKQVASFLLKRGLFLIVAEIVFVNFIMQFDYGSFIILEVIWVIGLSMVVFAGLQLLPIKVLVIIGFLLVFGHNLLDGIQVKQPVAASVLWTILHSIQLFEVSQNFTLLIAYPLLPWLGLMIVGYCVGKLYRPIVDAQYRKKFLLVAGIFAIVLFVLLRWTNGYGEISKWSAQRTLLYTFLSFLRVSKYPPSLLFMLITIGPALIVLSFAESINTRATKFLMVYGRVPFFYFLMHLLLIHSLAWTFYLISGKGTPNIDFTGTPTKLPIVGYPLWMVYIVWISVVLLLYYPCKWYGEYKASHPEKQWLSYL